MELRGPTNAELELREFLRRQTAGVVYALIAIMYVGRDGLAHGDFLAHYEQMSDTFPTPEIAIDQMLRKTPLADYLQRGIDRLAAAGIDVDALLL